MLVFARKADTFFRIGSDITVRILALRKKWVRIGVEAPTTVPVWRGELLPTEVSPPTADVLCDAHGDPLAVLLVEDDQDHAALIRRVISGVGSMELAVAQSGEQAMELLHLESPQGEIRPAFNFILLDLRLPGISGLDLLRRIRADPVQYLTPVVVLSSMDHDAAIGNCLEAGANAFVSKSGDMSAFRESVSRIANFWGHARPAPSRLARMAK